MTVNPYSQPSAAVQVEHDLLPPKPLAVAMYRFTSWIALLVSLLSFFQLFDPVRLASGQSNMDGIAPRLALFLAMGVAVFCGYRRNRLCKIVAILLIAALGVFLILLCLTVSFDDSRKYALLWISLTLVVFVAFMCWIYAFGFSVKALRYYSA